MPGDLSPTDQRIRNQIRERLFQMDPRLTQQELAQKLGVKQPSVADLLSGRRGQVPQSLIDLLDVLDMEIAVQPKQKTTL